MGHFFLWKVVFFIVKMKIKIFFDWWVVEKVCFVAVQKGYVYFSGKIGSFYSEMVNKSYLMNVMFLFLIEFCSKIELCKAH